MSKVMKIYIKYFASVRDVMGKHSEDLDVENNLTVDRLWVKLTLNLQINMKVMFAVNHEYVDKDFKLKQGDEIAFFPPVTGG